MARAAQPGRGERSSRAAESGTVRSAARRQAAPKLPVEGRRRVVIEAVSPEVDGGRFPAKRVVGELVVVEADIFADAHDSLAANLLVRHERQPDWTTIPMSALVNDRWRGQFPVTELGKYLFTIEGWIDHFETWRKRLAKRIEAGQDTRVEIEVGARLVEAASQRADGAAADAARLVALSKALRTGKADLDGELGELMRRHGERHITPYGRDLEVMVEPVKARYSTWYELFPRSFGTLRDVENMIPEVAEMGFDVLYLPPIHPIGTTHRKGANNRPAKAGEPGSPWAIGSKEGGHKSIHAELGTLDDFKSLVHAAKVEGIDIALDIAFQCSPDHPYAREHPEWFKHRPDGSIQFAENPPKKYEDIYPFDFETDSWRELWQELLSIFLFWADQGVRVFRVDNPHTKPFAFWEWLLAEVRRKHPDAIFLSEAFTRPKVMFRLAKLGFTQSYTYFAWRNTAYELYQYFTELTQSPVREFFRPNLWPNTPDILTEYLQTGGRPAFQARLILAATLGASYGIYGPPFLALEGRAREAGSEEYLDSEKYQMHDWRVDGAMRELVTIVNRIRRDNPALQTDRGLRFHFTENDQLLAYSKSTPDNSNVLLTVVNVDPHHVQRGWVNLPLAELGLETDRPYQAHELISGARYLWNGARNYVEINPNSMPGQIFLFRRRVRSEHDFEYFL
ncbi:MAG TPA: alpha-1,4-glucan--maltose-1-phosphate maltosyltransferase [Candidatus Dormibacteraeota bacterium]|nr:alpha-1,4-glucan--maltose-1-phosphate maltosyltransferase [Candidatus Dormibacteraeota bacterium]